MAASDTPIIRGPGKGRRFGRLALAGAIGVASAALLLLAAGAVYQQIAEARDRAAYPAPGRLVNIGDVALHLHCVGEGGPVIVLSSGMGNPASAWAPLQARLARGGQVCTYDRDGLGWSAESGLPRDAGRAADQLRRLLKTAGLAPPFVIAGHSYGALVARVFADAYPADVAGLVLIDSSHEDMAERFPPSAQKSFRDLLDGFSLAPCVNRVGAGRTFDLFAPAIDGLEGEPRARSLAHLNSVSHMVGTAAEAAGWERSAARARLVQDRGFGGTPLAVFVAGEWPEPMLERWVEMQRELATLSTRGTYHFVEGANHPQIMMDERFYPSLADRIAQMRESVRSETP